MIENADAQTRRRIGSRLRAARLGRNMTLAVASRATGISTSTLSRLEAGRRRATLTLLDPIARTYGVTLDDLVRVRDIDEVAEQRSFSMNGFRFVPLAREAPGLQAHKVIIPGNAPRADAIAKPRVHDGYAWLYVLRGCLRLVLGDREVVLNAGEAAEYETRVPHAMQNAGTTPVELISLFRECAAPIRLRARTVR